MKKADVILAVMILVFTLLPSIGCGSSVNGGLEGMVKRMPDNTNDFHFENLKKGRSIDAAGLNENYSSYLGMWRENTFDIGITPEKTDYLAWFFSDSPVSLFEGNFDLGNIREKLEESGMNSDEYRGVEIWKKGDSRGETGYESNIVRALVNDGLLLFGYELAIYDCIDVMKEDRESLWENGDFRDIIERLPDGLTVRCSIYWGDGRPEVEDIIVGGFSLAMNDDGTQDFTFVGKFESSEAAGNGIENILYDLAEDFGFDAAIAEATHDGEYITITAEGQEIW